MTVMNLGQLELSDDAKNLYGQPMFQLLTKANELEAQGKRILHFEIGDLGFKSPPDAIKAACDALCLDKTHYVNSMGIQELRDVICDEVERELGFRPTRKQVLVTPANAVIYWVVRCVLNRGEYFAAPDPGFPTYLAVARATGTNLLPVRLKEENNFRMSPDDLGDVFVWARLLIVNSPSNPTGAVMIEDEVEAIAKVAEKKNVWLLSDETYSKMIYDGRHYSPSIRDKCKKRTIILNSFSKAYSMTGWRLGYAVGPERLIAKMNLLLQTVISCVPPFVQWAGITALTDGREHNRRMLLDLRQRRNEIVGGMNSLKGVSCLEPEGAFYTFPNITKTGLSSQEFADLMLDRAGVALLPGTNFGQYGEGYVRLSYATARGNIAEAIDKMREVLE